MNNPTTTENNQQKVGQKPLTMPYALKLVPLISAYVKNELGAEVKLVDVKNHLKWFLLSGKIRNKNLQVRVEAVVDKDIAFFIHLNNGEDSTYYKQVILTEKEGKFFWQTSINKQMVTTELTEDYLSLLPKQETLEEAEKRKQEASEKFDKDIVKLSVASGLGAGTTFLHYKLTGAIFANFDSLLFTTFIFVFVLTTPFALFFLFNWPAKKESRA